MVEKAVENNVAAANQEDSLTKQMGNLYIDPAKPKNATTIKLTTTPSSSQGEAPEAAEENKKPRTRKPATGQVQTRQSAMIEEMKKKKREAEMNKRQRVGLVYDDQMLLHRSHQEHHVERPERVMSIWLNLVKTDDIFKRLTIINSEQASETELKTCHPPEHVAQVLQASMDKRKNYKEPLPRNKNQRTFSYDTYQNRDTAQAAVLAAGCTIEAVRYVCWGNVDTSFALIRPPGHHAHCEQVGGFCFFNNVAVAVRTAQIQENLKRVVIFDWDIHYGDGTSQIFYEDPTVLYISIHRYDQGSFYPGSGGKLENIGKDAGQGFNIQFPFNVVKSQEKVGDKDYIYACETILFPVIKAFDPELIVISAGFDSALGDPLGGVGVTPVGYAYMTHGLRSICGKLAVALEGGYNLDSLAVSSMAVIKTLLTKPNDSQGFDSLLQSLGEGFGYDNSVTQASLYLSSLHSENIRDTFRRTALRLANQLSQQWSWLGRVLAEAEASTVASSLAPEEELEYEHNTSDHPAANT